MTETFIQIIANIVISFTILIGTFFILSSSIGMIRFPDIYTRLHAATKASTLGIMNLILGAIIFLFFTTGTMSGKLILAFFFIVLTNPVAGHMLSRAAHHSGIKPTINKRKIDEYEDYLQ